MSYQHKPNSGSLFPNDRKEKDTDPSARGDCVIDGVEYWVAGWVNTTTSGTRYQSLKFRKKEPKAKVVEVEVPEPDPFDDPIPF